MLVAGKTTLLRTLAGKYQKDASLKVCGFLLATCTRAGVASVTLPGAAVCHYSMTLVMMTM